MLIHAGEFHHDCVDPIPECEGDFDNGGDLDGSDLAMFAVDFGGTDCP